MPLITWFRAAAVVVVLVAVAIPVAPAAAADPGPPEVAPRDIVQPPPAPAPVEPGDPEFAYESGELAPPVAAQNAFSYDPALAPVGADLQLIAVSGPGELAVVSLTARGLLPNRDYGAHLHQKACGAAPTDAGPHYQHNPDPVQPSTDPAFANPENEVWLDFTTDSQGTGVAFAKQAWRFTTPLPGSVVVHADHTHTAPGEAGTAGARLACLTIEF